MNRLLPALLAALALPAFSAVTFSGVDYDSSVDALTGGNIAVSTTGNPAFVYLDWTQGDTTVRVYLQGEGNSWSGTTPANHAGSASFKLYAEDADGVVYSYNGGLDQQQTYVENMTNPGDDGLTNHRYPDIYNWTIGASGKGNLDNNWYGLRVVRSSSIPQMISLLGSPVTNNPTFSGDTAGGFIRHRTKLDGGVGSIWFKARMAETNTIDGTIAIDRITSSGSGLSVKYSITEIAEVNIPASVAYNQWQQFHLILQDYPEGYPEVATDKAYFRIRNKTLAASSSDADRAAVQIDLCDIVLTPMIPDVAIVKDEMDYAPGFPSIQDPIEFHVTVSNLYENLGAPARHITPRLMWRQGANDTWKEKLMTNVVDRTMQEAGVYACTLEEADGVSDGPFEYFYKTDFTGYTPTFPAFNKYSTYALLNNIQNLRFDWGDIDGFYRYLVHTNVWALYTDASGNISECRSPAYQPDFYERYDNEAVEGSDHYVNYAFERAVVPGSAADVDNSGSWWGFARRFDLANLDEGWPSAKGAHFAEQPISTRTDFVNRRIEIPARFPYNTLKARDGIRRFRSLYTDIAAVTADWTNEAPSHLERAYAMQHVGDYTWQAILHVTNAVDALFSVTGALYAAEGATSYAPGPFEWLELDQEDTNINPPMSGQWSEAHDSSLKRFATIPVEKTRTVTKSETVFVPNATTNTGWFVGVVTNLAFYAADYTNELGARIRPTIDDVGYWAFELYTEETEDRITGEITVSTNGRPVLANWSQDASGLWTARRYGDRGINEFITRGDSIRFTNETQTVVTDVTFDATERTWTEEETYVEWEPDPEDLPEGVSRLRTRVQIDYDGFLMFRFCTTNGEYQIRRAAWQDFNTWQADDSSYWRSAGLYDMKTFTSDLEGRALTTFPTNFTTLFLDRYAAENVASRASGETVEDWWSDAAQGEYWNGLMARNAQLFLEREPDDPKSRTSTTRNGAILLNTYPKSEGSIQTSNLQTGNGRDTLRMRVRSLSADDRLAVYDDAAAAEAQNYRVVARIRNPGSDQVSDGEYALSLIGYWQDPFNYWEARIVQKKQLVTGTGGTLSPRNWFEVQLYKVVDGDAYPVYGGQVQHSSMRYHGESYTTTATKPATWPGRYSNWNTNTYDHAYKDGNVDYGNMYTTGDGGWAFALDMRTVGSGSSAQVQPTVYAFRQNQIGNFATNANNHRVVYPAQDGGTTSGKPGYNLRDCGLQIAPYVYDLGSGGGDSELAKLRTWAASSAAAWGSVPISKSADWYHTADSKFDRKQKIDVWQVTQGSAAATAPSVLTRRKPTVYYGVQVYRTGAEVATNLFVAPIGQVSGSRTAAWDDGWDAYHGHSGDGVMKSDSWKWSTVEIPMAFWDDTFIKIQAFADNGASSSPDPSLAMLAVDSLECADWRGVTLVDPEGADDESGFSARYAAIAQDGREGRKYELNRSRANPNQNRTTSRQGVASPYLEKGVGDISFTYTVKDHPVNISVGVLDSAGNWSPFSTATLAPTNVATPYYVYIATNVSGRIYVTTDDPDAACRTNGQLGTLYLDNLRATDYPATGSTSWEAYNMLVSTFSKDLASRKLKFDGISDAARSMRSAVLNDGYSRDTINNATLDEHVPNLQTPSIETGIGEVSFWYRASPDNGGKPAKITLLVSDSANRPDELWTPLTVDNLYTNLAENPRYPEQVAAMEALTNITTSTWTYFNVEFYEQDYRVLRVVAGDGVHMVSGQNRVMLDNVLVTEPVRSSIDIGAIEFDPGVPLSTKDTGAKVTLVNPRMNPHDIRVYLDWFVAPGTSADYEIPTVTYTVWTQEVEQTLYYDVTTGEVVDRSHRNDPGVIAATWYEKVEHVTTNETVEVTRIPAGLSSKWGQAEWGSRPTGTLEFTNAPGSAYVFLSDGKIPTDRYPPDTVVQYDVRVEYEGRFAAPIHSETQGRVKNGYWFSNPPWYEPIDLNVAFGAGEAPVSHFFVFSCPTNTAFINEFRAWMGPTASAAEYLKNQFVEIAGPEGASLGNWKLEHWGIVSRTIDPSWVYFTNKIAADAVFRHPYNATTNKGWGFYVLGGSGIRDRNEALFPGSDETSIEAHTAGNRYLDPAQGALRLRRSMGAYVDRICWGTHNQVGDLERDGFTWMDYIRNYSRENRASYVYAIVENNGELAWGSSSSDTYGGYNLDEEDLLPWLDGTQEEKPVPPLLGQPLITGFAFSEDGATLSISFQVCVTNEVELTGDETGISWDLESKSTLDPDADWSSHVQDGTATMPATILAPADGSWSEEYTATVTVNPNDAARFYRIKAKVEE